MVVVMSLDKLKKTRSNILSSSSSKYSTDASYDLYSTIVSLDSVSDEDINWLEIYAKEKSGTVVSSLDVDDIKKSIKIMSLAVHEYTHYLDCTATVWGFNYMSLMMDAYLSNTGLYPSATESGYHKAMDFHRYVRFIRLPEYYTLVKRSVCTPQSWSYQPSLGSRYDPNGFVSDHPILFMRFFNSDKELLVRSPISTLSVLECSAMANEVVFKTRSIDSLEGTLSYHVEKSSYKDELDTYLYNSDITEYSVCAHLVSSTLGIKDTYQVFLSCSILCRFILNSTKEVFDKIHDSLNFNDIFDDGTDAEFVEKIKKGISLGEVGILFYVLILVLKKTGVKNVSKESIYGALSFMGVSYDFYNETIDSLLTSYMLKATCSMNKFLYHIAYMGMLNSKEMRSFDDVINFANVITPPAYTSSLNGRYIFMSNDSKFNLAYKNMPDIEELYNFMVIGQKWVSSFSEAC